MNKEKENQEHDNISDVNKPVTPVTNDVVPEPEAGSKSKSKNTNESTDESQPTQPKKKVGKTYVPTNVLYFFI